MGGLVLPPCVENLHSVPEVLLNHGIVQHLIHYKNNNNNNKKGEENQLLPQPFFPAPTRETYSHKILNY